MAKKEQRLVTNDGYMVPTAVDSDNPFTAEDLAEEAVGLTPKFPQVKIPSGGMIAFEVPNLDDPDNPDSEKVIEGVILHHHAANAYWASDDDDDMNTPPDCSSFDGQHGIGIPGGDCASCAMNQWDSGEGGKGKACKNMRQVYLAREGEAIPILLSLPPTSLGAFNDYINRAFMFRQRGSCGSVTQISLKKMENANGKPYSVAVFKNAGDLSGDQLKEWIAYAKDFKKQIKAMHSMKQQAKVDMETGEIIDQ